MVRRNVAAVQAKLDVPANPMEECYESSASLIEQTLRQAELGILGKQQRRRLQSYERYLHMPFLQVHAERGRAALGQAAGLPTYVGGDEIVGDALRKFSNAPILTPPLACMLCEGDGEAGTLGFVSERAFTVHCDKQHGGYAEYRKRVRYLLEQ